MKKILVDLLLDNFAKAEDKLYQIDRLNAVIKYASLFKSLNLNQEVVALFSVDKKIQEAFQIACFLQGINYIVIDRIDIDSFVVVNLNAKVVLYDSSDLEFTPTELFEYTSINLLVDARTCKIIGSYEITPAELLAIDANIRKANSITDLRLFVLESFKKELVKGHVRNMIYVQHPGISTFGSKISIFHSEAFENGAVKVLDTLYHEIKSKNLLSKNQQISILSLETPAIPYVFLNSVFLALISKGTVKYNDSIKQSEYLEINILFGSVDSLHFIFTQIIEESSILSYLSPNNFLFRLVFRHMFNKKFKNLKLIMFYGKTSKYFRRLLNYTGKSSIYMYTLIEVTSFVSFETYKKLPVKELPTVGIIPNGVILNAINPTKESEVLLDVADSYTNYTNIEFTNLCRMSEKFPGTHATLDIAKNVNGKLQIIGKADEILHNEHSLSIQTDLINSIALDNRYVKDTFVTTYSGRLILFVEIKLSVLLWLEKTIEDVKTELNTVLLPKINKKVQPFSRVHKIIVLPEGFERGNNKHIKHIKYMLGSH
jgi:hypothetical protein